MAAHGNTIRKKILSPLGILLCCVPVASFALGTWQVRRRTWKLNLIDELDEKLQRPPMRLPQQIKFDAIPEFSYRRVVVRGKFDHSKEILIGPKMKEGHGGYDVYTPLCRDDGGSPILVNRGFVSKAHKERSQRPDSQTTEEVSITGFLRSQPIRNYFTPENRPDRDEWVFPDIEQLAAKTNSSPVLVDEIFSGDEYEIHHKISQGVPVGRPSVVEIRNMHSTYAVTWYSLSFVTTIMLFGLRRSIAK